MAILPASKSTVAWGSSPCVIPKPTGLAAGDLMVAYIGSLSDSPGFTPPAGWTALEAVDAGAESWGNFYKVADAGDAAATNFSFTIDDAEQCMGGIVRITGAGATPNMTNRTIQLSASGVFNTADLTPAAPDSLFLFSVFNINGNTPAGYAMVTSNPTWTEQWNLASGAGQALALATAVRPEATATGDFSVSVSDNFSYGGFICIAPAINVTVSPTVITATLSIQAPSVSAGATVSPAVITMALSIQSPTVTLGTPDWLNTDKNNVSMVNQIKTNLTQEVSVTESPDTMANINIGGVSWSTIDNAKLSDNAYATVTLSGIGSPFRGNQSNKLQATNFGFSIPDGSIISGILVEIEAKISTGTIDMPVKLMQAGVVLATTKNATITTSEAYQSFGGAADLWSDTWTPSFINSSEFGVSIEKMDNQGQGSQTISVDHIRVTVYYTNEISWDNPAKNVVSITNQVKS